MRRDARRGGGGEGGREQEGGGGCGSLSLSLSHPNTQTHTNTLPPPQKTTNKHSIPIPAPLPAGLGWDNQYGYISIFTLGLSLAAATVFSEAMWQRVWASASRRTLHAASGLGCGLIIVVVFISGFLGWLALVGGLVDPATTSINLYLFQVWARCARGLVA